MMTNQAYSASPLTFETRSPSAGSDGLFAHGALIGAMALVAAALAVFAAKSLGLTQAMAGGLGLAVLAMSIAVHAIVARPDGPARARSRAPGSTRTGHAGGQRKSRPKRRHDGAPQAIVPGQADERVRPSDLALDLLARVQAPVADAAANPPQVRLTEDRDALSTLSVRGGWADQGGELARSVVPEAASVVDPSGVGAKGNETELQRVERLVRRLADQVNGQDRGASMGLARRAALPAAAHPAPLAAAVSAAPSLTPPPLPGFAAAAVGEPGTEASPAPHRLPQGPETGPYSDQLVLNLTSAIASLPKWPEPAAEPSPDTALNGRREAVLSALHAQRVDVYLEPILGIADQRPQHYEVSIGLRGGQDELIDLAEAATSLSGTGLLPLIDTTRIAKAGQMARRLAERGKTGAVLTSVSAEGLFDRETEADLTGRGSAGAFPGQLVLMMPQALVRLFSGADWQTLARLRAAGFGFALTDVTSLDMDFGELSQAGFTFARLDAATFLVGLPVADGIVPPGDICRQIAANGLALIVGGIVEDDQLARIFGFGVVFGQGQLFGGPRPVVASNGAAHGEMGHGAGAAHA